MKNVQWTSCDNDDDAAGRVAKNGAKIFAVMDGKFMNEWKYT